MIWFALSALCLTFGLGSLLYIYISAIVSPDLLRPDSHYLNIDDFTVHYWEAGSKTSTTLVLIHGLGANVICWRILMPLLARDFHVVAIDLPGFGKSTLGKKAGFTLDQQAERIRKFLERKGIQKPVFVGSSMGGTLSLWLARTLPWVQAVIAISPATNPKVVPFRADRWAWTSPLLKLGVNRAVIGLALRRVVNVSTISREVVSAYLEPYARDRKTIHAFLSAVKTLGDPRLPNDLKGLRVPVLILYGDKDRVIPRIYMEELAKILSTAKLRIHATAGHHLQEDDAKWVEREIREFLSPG